MKRAIVDVDVAKVVVLHYEDVLSMGNEMMMMELGGCLDHRKDDWWQWVNNDANNGDL